MVKVTVVIEVDGKHFVEELKAGDCFFRWQDDLYVCKAIEMRHEIEPTYMGTLIGKRQVPLVTAHVRGYPWDKMPNRKVAIPPHVAEHIKNGECYACGRVLMDKDVDPTGYVSGECYECRQKKAQRERLNHLAQQAIQPLKLDEAEFIKGFEPTKQELKHEPMPNRKDESEW